LHPGLYTIDKRVCTFISSSPIPSIVRLY